MGFCKYLQKDKNTSGLTFDLPTEAQWDGRRAGSGDRYWWGRTNKTGRVANVGDKSLKRVHPIDRARHADGRQARSWRRSAVIP